MRCLFVIMNMFGFSEVVGLFALEDVAAYLADKQSMIESDLSLYLVTCS